MEGTDKNPLDDDQLRAELYAMSEKDPDGFTDEIYQILERFPEFIVNDTAPVENKRAALTRMIKQYESREMYERCGFLKSQLSKLDEV